MCIARSKQFDQGAPPWLHCVSRCVRRAFLCGAGFEHRRGWIEGRLKLLVQLFTVDLAAYAVMSNHLHVVIRPRPERIRDFSDYEIAKAWFLLKSSPLPGEDSGFCGEIPHLSAEDEAQIETLLSDEEFLATWRERFASASWFMKALKEPIARAANHEDDCTGAFWEGRFRSTPLLDEAALLTCMAYVDLNSAFMKKPSSYQYQYQFDMEVTVRSLDVAGGRAKPAAALMLAREASWKDWYHRIDRTSVWVQKDGALSRNPRGNDARIKASFPIRLKVERRGSAATFYANKGGAWKEVGRQTGVTGALYPALAVHHGAFPETFTAEFSDLKIVRR